MNADRTRTVRGFAKGAGLALLVLGLVSLGVSSAGADTHDAPQGFDAAAASEPALPEPSEDRFIGRVTGVHGRVYAESPDGTRRPLVENAPIYPGDRLVTHRGAQLGVLSGDHYTGLNEDTELSFALTPGGAPEVRLVRGHVRVIDAGDESAPARVTTPALEVAAAGTDTEVFAFPEKAYLVSMVCALEGQVRAASVAGESATVAEGGCAIAKPVEGIYAAGGAGSALAPVGAAGPGGAPRSASGTAADHFAGPDDVAGGARLFAAHTAPSFDLDQQLFMPCSGAAAAACAASVPPPNPPSNPPVPGLPPPGFPPPNPPSNSPVPGLPPTP